MAASKFAECQKTIASLGQQLRSLATLEDFLTDSEKPLELIGEGIQGPKNGREPLKLQFIERGDGTRLSKSGSERESSFSLNPTIALENTRNGFGKFLPRSKSVSRNENQRERYRKL